MSLTNLIGPVTGLLDKFIEDKDQKANLAHEISMLAHTTNMAQVGINKVEAAHRSVFVAGWRPFIGWICGFAIIYQFLVANIIDKVAYLSGADISSMPVANVEGLLTIVLGMIGIGGMRTMEKIRGVAK